MKPIRLVSTLCAVAILSTGVAAWTSATESALVTCQLIEEMRAGHAETFSRPARNAYARIPLASRTPSFSSAGNPAAASACNDFI
jgi:hypothetical protein